MSTLSEPTPNSAIFDNAIDSLRTGMQFYRDGRSKYAVMLVFHSLELLLKEAIARRHPLLIYRTIDKPVSEASQTIGVADALTRMHNLGIAISVDERDTIRSLQDRRNAIEHHRYSPHKNDLDVLGEALRFIRSFVEQHLNTTLQAHVPSDLIDHMNAVVLSYEDRMAFADHLLDTWIAETYPNDEEAEYGTPGSFEGTHRCPRCRRDYLVLRNQHRGTYCFYCVCPVEADICDFCGSTYVIAFQGQPHCQPMDSDAEPLIIEPDFG